MSYLAPPSRHRSRVHTRDKVLTPFRPRSPARDPTATGSAQVAGTDTLAAIQSGQSQPSTWTTSSSETATDSSYQRGPLEPPRIESNNTTTTTPADNGYLQQQMSSTSAQRVHRIPIVVENYDNWGTKVAGSSATSSTNAGFQGRPLAASSSTSSAAAAPADRRPPATAPKPAVMMRPGAESASQHHRVTAVVTYQPSSHVVTSDQTRPAPQQPPTLPSSSVSSSSVSLRPTRPFGPTAGGTEPPSVADGRPWSPRTGQYSAQFAPDQVPNHSASVSDSQHPHGNKFAVENRALSPPINPLVSTGVVRVPYVPTTAAVARSSSPEANAHVLPITVADSSRQVLPSSPSSSVAVANVSFPVNHPALTTTNVAGSSTDTRPFSPTSRFAGDQPTAQQPGYRMVAAPNPNSVNTDDYRSSSGIVQNQKLSFGTSPNVPIAPGIDKLSATKNTALGSPNLPTYNSPEGYVIPGQQRSDLYQPFSPQTAQVNVNMRPFSPNSDTRRPVEDDQKPSVVPFYQPHPQNYQRPETSAMSGTSQVTSFNLASSQVPSVNFQSHPMNYQMSESGPYVGSQAHPPSYQQPETYMMPSVSQAQPFTPQISQVPSVIHQSYPDNYQQSETSTVPGPPFSSQPYPQNYQQLESPALLGTSQAAPFSLQFSQAPSSMNYQSESVNYQMSDSSTMPYPSFSPQRHPLQQPPTSTMSSSSFNPQSNLQNYRQPEFSTVPGTAQIQPVNLQSTQVPSSMNYQSHPMNYQMSDTSAMPDQSFYPHPHQLNFQQPKASAVSGTPQVKPFNLESSQVQSVTTTVQGPSSGHHIGVKQHIQRFSAPPNTQMNSIYSRQQQQQQPAARPIAPAVTSYVGAPSNLPKFPNDSHMTASVGNSFGQKLDNRPFSLSAQQALYGHVMSPTFDGSHDQVMDNRAFSPSADQSARQPVNYPVSSPNVAYVDESVGQRMDTRVFSPSGDQSAKQSVNYPVTSPTSLVPVDGSTGQGVGNRPFSPSTDQTAKKPVYHPVASGTVAPVNKFDSPKIDSRPFSPSRDESVKQPVYRHITSPTPVPLMDSSTGQRMDIRTFTPSEDQSARQPQYRPLTSQIPTPTDSSFIHRRMDNRPFSPKSDQSAKQPVYHSDTSPFPPAAVDSSNSQNVDNRPFSPSDQTARKPVYHPVANATVAPVDNVDNVDSSKMDNQPFSPLREQPAKQPVYRHVTSPTPFATVDSFGGQKVMDTRPFSPSVQQPVHRPLTTPTPIAGMDNSGGPKVDNTPLSPSTNEPVKQTVYHPVVSSTIGNVDSSVDQRVDNRPTTPSSVTDVNLDRALSPTARPFSPSVSLPSRQRPSSAPTPTMSGGTTANIQGYRRICFSPIPQQAQPAHHRASPLPLMMSQQTTASDVPPAVATKESRITVSAARLVFAPRRGSDVTTSTPSYLASSPARQQLNVLRENQVVHWKDIATKPVIWTPSAAAAPRSRSLEPTPGTVNSIQFG